MCRSLYNIKLIGLDFKLKEITNQQKQSKTKIGSYLAHYIDKTSRLLKSPWTKQLELKEQINSAAKK